MFGKLAGVPGFALSEKENVSAAEEKDELAEENIESEAEEEEREKDIWEAPDGEEVSTKSQNGRRRGATDTPSKATPSSRGKGKTGSARLSKKDIYEVDDSEEERYVGSRAGTRINPNIDRITHIPKSTSKVGNEHEENGTPKRGRGRPPKHIETAVPSPVTSLRKPRKSDILKKAKKLSREAAFQAMVEAGQKRAAEESQGTSTRRRSGRSNAEAEVEENDDSTETIEVEAADTPRPRGRPKKDKLEGSKGVPSGMMRLTKYRIKAKKSMAFEFREDFDLGFKDLPDSANKTSTSKKNRKSRNAEQEKTEESQLNVNGKKQTDPVVIVLQADKEGEVSDEEA